MNSIEFPEMNYKHFREKNAKFHIFLLLLSIMGGISLITIYDRKFWHNRPEEGLPKMITYFSPINMVAEDNHLYFAYKSPLGLCFAHKLFICKQLLVQKKIIVIPCLGFLSNAIYNNTCCNNTVTQSNGLSRSANANYCLPEGNSESREQARYAHYQRLACS